MNLPSITPWITLSSFFFAALPAVSWAHDFSILVSELTLRNDETFQVNLRCDLDALVLGVAPGSTAEEDHQRLMALSEDEKAAKTGELLDLLQRRIRTRFDGQVVELFLEFPRQEDTAGEGADLPVTAFGTLVRLSGSVPLGAEQVTFWASRAFGLVSFAVRNEHGEQMFARTLKPGEESDPFPLHSPPQPQSAFSATIRYLILGFEHIVPKGLDHILFVLGLYLLSPGLRPLLWQVTAFTIAHSLTLALSMYDVVSLPSRVVEPLIALSIAYVAVENTLTTKLKPWRPAVVFGFGLLHGMGFAGVLSELGLPRDQFLTALFSFNVGVELGQLTVIALAFLVTGWLRQRTWYRVRVVVPASIAIALVGAYWAVERLWG